MRLAFIAAASGLMLISLAATASAQCEDKSQQNAADEAAIKGDLAAASMCAGPKDVAKSEQKLEDAAARAKGSSDEKGGTDNRPTGTPPNGEGRENPGSR